MINNVDVLIAALLGLVLGLAYAPTLAWLRRRAELDAGEPEQVPVVSEQLAQAVGLLRSAALVGGPYDEVLHSNPQARTLGLVRGNRVAPDELLDLVRQVRQQRRVLGTVLRLPRELGTPQLELAVRLRGLSGGMVLVVADDRSAQVRTEEIKRDFVANVSHELKTPVGAIRVLAEAVEQACDDPVAVQRFATRMIHASVRLEELVRQIIELSRLQSDEPLLHPSEVVVDDVIAAAAGQCRELAASSSIGLTASGTPGLRVLGDEEQLTSAVVNLITNAINYSDPGGRVAVSSRLAQESDDGYVEISVADNGIGIRSDELDRIFERFYRVDFARSRDSGGTGLGLSIVKHVIGAHGGTVNVWSKVGQGSTFTLRLPALDPATPSDAAVLGAPPVPEVKP